MSHSAVPVAKITPGMVIYAPPGPLIVADVLTSQTLSQQRKDKHPLLVLSVHSAAQEITVTYIASFVGSSNLAGVQIPESAKKLFVPVKPATKEFDHEPINWEKHPGPTACWVSVRNKTVLTGAEFKIFDDGKSFSAETAAKINALIKTVV